MDVKLANIILNQLRDDLFEDYDISISRPYKLRSSFKSLESNNGLYIKFNDDKLFGQFFYEMNLIDQVKCSKDFNLSHYSQFLNNQLKDTTNSKLEELLDNPKISSEYVESGNVINLEYDMIGLDINLKKDSNNYKLKYMFNYSEK